MLVQERTIYQESGIIEIFPLVLASEFRRVLIFSTWNGNWHVSTRIDSEVDLGHIVTTTQPFHIFLPEYDGLVQLGWYGRNGTMGEALLVTEVFSEQKLTRNQGNEFKQFMETTIKRGNQPRVIRPFTKGARKVFGLSVPKYKV